MDLFFVIILQVVTSVAMLALISLGLAIIFGMMRVINLAHGEFLMLGGYAAILATGHGVNLWIAMLLVAPLFVAIIGVVVERLMIRRLYGRMIDTMLATWGLSLTLIGLVTMIFGNTNQRLLRTPRQRRHRRLPGVLLRVVPDPLHAGPAGRSVWPILRFTRLGLIARGTMQNPDMAAAWESILNGVRHHVCHGRCAFRPCGGH